MPILSFNEGDRLAAAIVPDGFYKTIIISIKAEPSKSGKSLNFWTELQIVEGKLTGKEKKILFNSETGNASILGDLQVLPHNKFLEVSAAILGVKLDEVPLQVDTDQLTNKPFDAKWSKNVSPAGGIMNTIDAFLPTGKGATAAGNAPF